MATKIMTADEFCVMLCEQLDMDPSVVNRIVVDAKAGEMVRIYIERFVTGAGRLVLKLPHEDEMKVEVLD